MSRRLLLLEIDANVKTCGRCRAPQEIVDRWRMARCMLFNAWRGKGIRLSRCLAAERRAKEARRV